MNFFAKYETKSLKTYRKYDKTKKVMNKNS